MFYFTAQLSFCLSKQNILFNQYQLVKDVYCLQTTGIDSNAINKWKLNGIYIDIHHKLEPSINLSRLEMSELGRIPPNDWIGFPEPEKFKRIENINFNLGVSLQKRQWQVGAGMAYNWLYSGYISNRFTSNNSSSGVDTVTDKSYSVSVLSAPINLNTSIRRGILVTQNTNIFLDLGLMPPFI